MNNTDALLAKLSAIAYAPDALTQYHRLKYRAAALHHPGATDEVYILSNGTDLCIVARGSNDWQDWARRNILALPNYVPTLGIRAHWGLWDAARSVLAAAEAAIVMSRPDTITITGHSKGGAMAVLLGLALAKYKPAVVSFGCPRVLASENLPYLNHRRIVHYLDPVPRVPPRVAGWVHEGLPVVISENDAVIVGDSAWAAVVTERFDIRSLPDRVASHFEYGPEIRALWEAR